MRLIQLSIGEYNVLKDLTIVFSPASPDYQRGYDIDFLVGLNGTGKSTILRLLAEIFLRLEGAGGTLNTVPFAFTISYSLSLEGQDQIITITNNAEEDQAKPFIERSLHMTIDDEPRIYDKSLLPSSIVILTTGQEQDWYRVRQILRQRDQPQPLVQQPSSLGQIISEYVGRSNTSLSTSESYSEATSQRVTFIRTSQLPLVMLCELLDHALGEQALQSASRSGFADVLSQSDIRGLAGFSLRFRITDPLGIDPLIEKIYRECHPTRVLRLGNERLFVFDMSKSLQQRARQIVEPFSDSFALFLRLATLCDSPNPEENVLQEINIFLERIVKQPAGNQDEESDQQIEHDIPLHLFSWMSDGEQSFLARMALLSLMRSQGALIFLDEPEVHFNDYWKRHIVNLIHQTLQHTGSHVLITTHSSITLTDVPSQDIIKIVRSGPYTTDTPRPLPIRTLAADPSDIMVHVFDTGYATGERAVQEVLSSVKPGSVLTKEERARLKRLQEDVAPGYWSYLIRHAIG
ncbi:MAG TPA: AAA family ATPase [Herpetosiphonaceae bacterium]